MAESIPVRVALRCRPMSNKEITEGCQSCLEFIPDVPQVVIGSNKSFTYDFAFSPAQTQDNVYVMCVKPLLKNIFKGYNVTILAYGQTGSGKTYTMGTEFASVANVDENKVGIIPRAVNDLFSEMQDQTDTEFCAKVSFLEIYKEDIIDLLNSATVRDDVVIREDSGGGVKIVGLQEFSVKNLQETMNCLEKGSMVRTTGATAMNAQSSRSHAIFTISIQSKGNSENNASYISKFHFVDLAGSERAKKTKAEGDRLKEGININLGLLALGNVISALCEGSNRNHVPYRESKLTRLLQDSLGGNSHTVMIACVSPADTNIEETLNTLRYAHRARRIKNKPIVNRDPATAEIARLKQLVRDLQMQLNPQGEDPTKLENGNDATPIKDRISTKALLQRIEELEIENEKLSRELQIALEQTTELCEKVIVSDMKHDRMKKHLAELSQTTSVTLEIVSQSTDDKNPQMQENLDLIRGLKNRVSDIQAEQNKNELLLVHDNTTCQNAEETKPQDDSQFQYDKESTLRQAEMNRQLHTLNKVLEMKEELAGRLAANYNKIDYMKEHYEQNMKELEDEVSTLQAEKEELLKALQAAKNNSASNKVSEQRRQRLKELEQKIAELQKKVTEYDRIKRMKEQSDEKVKKLNEEILEMKQARVRLVRQMKTEAEKQKQWKLEKEKEVCRLKQKERLCQVEIVRKQQMFDKQQNVLKRKMEEAVAVNKRLKEALLQQKLNMDKRNKENNDLTGQNRVRKILEQELHLAVSSKEASNHLQCLLEDRKMITAQLAQLQKMMKAQMGSSSSLSSSDSADEVINSNSPIPVSHLRKQISELEADIELRNVQITDLQQKLLDADQEERRKGQWSAVQTMADAKVGLKTLFDMCVSAKADSSINHFKLSELEKEKTDMIKTLDILKNDNETMKLKFEQTVAEMQKEHQDEVLLLLCQLPKTTNVELSDKDSMEHLNKESGTATITCLKDQLQQKNMECEKLKMELQQALDQKDKTSIPPKKKKQTSAAKLQLNLDYDHSDLDESFDYEDNVKYDPDWHMTPLAKRLREMKSKDKFLSSKIEPCLMQDSSSEFESVAQGSTRGRKRKSDEKKCSCGTGCQTKRCTCFKNGTKCTDQCGCTKCLNAVPESDC